MAIYLVWQILRFTYNSIIPIKKLSRRHLINSFDLWLNKGFTVHIAIFTGSIYIVSVLTKEEFLRIFKLDHYHLSNYFHVEFISSKISL